jgi:DNA (cytosine-5)-methyltransferase 1
LKVKKFGGEKVLRGGICPTLRANKTSSGVIEVMADVNVIGSLEAKFESTNRIYDVGGCSPTLSTMQGGNQEPKILESQIVAMRGRNPDNPSDTSVGSPTEQRLEANTQGTSNCLTSVQKDNLVMESSVLTPKRTEYGKAIRKAYENGEVQESRHNMTELEPRTDGVSNTLTTVQKDNLVIEPQYRIRKLTPRECGRLMGVSDEDISKMAAVNSNTQMYKQFGNSIVVDVMCAMFENLNISQ